MADLDNILIFVEVAQVESISRAGVRRRGANNMIARVSLIRRDSNEHQWQ
jgi:hypothetical protein